MNSAPSQKILIVDDSKVDRELATLVCEQNGYCVKALESITSIIETIELEKPDIILLDVIMPKVNGNELLKIIRSKWSQIELPVIMITSKSEAEDVIESLKLGANDYIQKPVEFDVALRRIESHLTIVEMSKRMNQLKEIDAIHSVIATYNHELNNPLTIAIGHLDFFKEKYKEEPDIQTIETALWRIAEIVKKTKSILTNKNFEFEEYTPKAKILNLKKDS